MDLVLSIQDIRREIRESTVELFGLRLWLWACRVELVYLQIDTGGLVFLEFVGAMLKSSVSSSYF